jgi:hypothetical protein
MSNIIYVKHTRTVSSASSGVWGIQKPWALIRDEGYTQISSKEPEDDAVVLELSWLEVPDGGSVDSVLSLFSMLDMFLGTRRGNELEDAVCPYFWTLNQALVGIIRYTHALA